MLNMKGLKLDSEKLQWSLLPIWVLSGVVRVLMFGAKKYAPGNWQKVDNAKVRYTNALKRHLFAIDSGEEVDSESGLKHIWHLTCNAVFLMWFDMKKEK